MSGVVIATSFIAFVLLLVAFILMGIGGSREMRAGISDADLAKAKRLAMIGYWLGVAGMVFLLIAAIASSCRPELKILSGLRERFVTRRPVLEVV